MTVSQNEFSSLFPTGHVFLDSFFLQMTFAIECFDHSAYELKSDIGYVRDSTSGTIGNFAISVIGTIGDH